MGHYLGKWSEGPIGGSQLGPFGPCRPLPVGDECPPQAPISCQRSPIFSQPEPMTGSEQLTFRPGQ